MPIKSPTRLYDNIESELLREQLVGTSAESPAEAFVKRLFNPSPASQSKTEELLRERFAAAEARAAAELAAAESRATAAEEGLASFKESATSAESRAASASAEASLAASTTRVKDSALENEDLREQLAASEAAVAALHAPSSFEVPTTKGAVPHRRLEGEIDAASEVDAKGVDGRRRGVRRLGRRRGGKGGTDYCHFYDDCNFKEGDHCYPYAKIYDYCYALNGLVPTTSV